MWHHVSGCRGVLDRRIQTAGGEVLGRVEDVVVELGSGDVLYVIVRLHGRLGHPLYAVPWSFLHAAFNLPAFIIDADASTFASAPALIHTNESVAEIRRYVQHHAPAG